MTEITSAAALASSLQAQRRGRALHEMRTTLPTDIATSGQGHPFLLDVLQLLLPQPGSAAPCSLLLHCASQLSPPSSEDCERAATLARAAPLFFRKLAAVYDIGGTLAALDVARGLWDRGEAAEAALIIREYSLDDHFDGASILTTLVRLKNAQAALKFVGRRTALQVALVAALEESATPGR